MPKTIILSRTDSIGDVVLTLPMAGILKEIFPDCRIVFLGKSYTRPVVETCSSIDAFYDWGEVEKKGILMQSEMLQEIKADVILHVFPRKDIAVAAMKTGIPVRVGTTGRLWHYWTCNRLVRLSRKKSDLHEAQLNTKLLRPLGIEKEYTLEELYPYFHLENLPAPDPRIDALLTQDKTNVILHPLSKGSAREWGLQNFMELARMLAPEQYNVFVTGTREEGLEIRSSEIFSIPWVYDLTGRLSLQELIAFIARADALVAASTGPLHLAAALGKKAIGIYPPIRPMHPGRWAPVGPQAVCLVKDIPCNECRYGKECHCMKEISPLKIFEYLS
ncbi:MAG: glycosyltransferase family 9 protein [Bacteroidales bacterium]